MPIGVELMMHQISFLRFVLLCLLFSGCAPQVSDIFTAKLRIPEGYTRRDVQVSVRQALEAISANYANANIGASEIADEPDLMHLSIVYEEGYARLLRDFQDMELRFDDGRVVSIKEIAIYSGLEGHEHN